MDRSLPASTKKIYARYTIAAAELLGALVKQARKSRRMTAQELAERLGVARGTVQRLERGDPKIELGLAFEACAMFGIPLFEEDPSGLAVRLDAVSRQTALLPKYARPKRIIVDDDF